MIAAAKADGHIDETEKPRIFGKLDAMDWHEARAFVIDELENRSTSMPWWPPPPRPNWRSRSMPHQSWPSTPTIRPSRPISPCWPRASSSIPASRQHRTRSRQGHGLNGLAIDADDRHATATAARFGTLARESFHRLFADEAIPLAGNIAFRVIFSLFPFLIFLTALAGFFGNDDLAAQRRDLSAERGTASAGAGAGAGNPLDPHRAAHRAAQLSALLTIWSAMGGVDCVRVGLNRAYDLRDTRPFWWTYLQNVLFVIGAAVFMLVSPC